VTNPWDDANADDDLFEELSSTNTNQPGKKSFDFVTGPNSETILDSSLALLGTQFINNLFGNLLHDVFKLAGVAIQQYFMPHSEDYRFNAVEDTLTYLSNGTYPYILRKHKAMDSIAKFRAVEISFKNKMTDCYSILAMLNDSQNLTLKDLADKYKLDEEILSTIKDIHANRAINMAVKAAQYVLETAELILALWYEEMNLIFREYEDICITLNQEPDTVFMQTGFAESDDGSKYLENSILQYVTQITGKPISL